MTNQPDPQAIDNELHEIEIELSKILDNHLQEFRSGHAHIVYEKVIDLILYHKHQWQREARIDEQLWTREKYFEEMERTDGRALVTGIIGDRIAGLISTEGESHE